MNVFITGGSSGLGLALGVKFLEAGHKVGFCSRSKEKFDENSKNLLAKFEGQFCYYECDVTDGEKLKTVVANFIGDGSIDIMIANAGIPTGKKKRLPNFEILRRVIDVNVNGVLNSFEAALPHMLDQKSGQIVAVSSLAGYNGLPGVSAYSASKSAVMKICESFAIDLKRENISVTALCPGFIKTPLTDINPHPMPFLLSLEKGSELMYKAILKRKKRYSFPFPLFTLVWFLSVLPRPLYIWLMSADKWNYSVKN